MHVARYGAALVVSLVFGAALSVPRALAQQAASTGPSKVWCRLSLYDVFDDPQRNALEPSASVAPYQTTVSRMVRLAGSGRAKLLAMPSAFTIAAGGSTTFMLGANASTASPNAATPDADGIAISIQAQPADDGSTTATIALIPHGPSLRVSGLSVTRVRELSARSRLKSSDVLVLSGFYNAQDDASTESFFGEQNAIGAFAGARASDTLHDTLVVLLEMHRQDQAQNSGPMPPASRSTGAFH